MRTIPKNCLHCQVVFEASLKEHNRGNAKFCSRECSSLNKKGKTTEQPHNCECATCGTTFYRNNSKMKKSRHGYYFCSRECKEQAHTLSNPNRIGAIIPNHYKNGERVYRETAFRFKAMECEDCGFDRVPEVLEVHHIDRDRSNGNITNLKVLCPTCHQIEHYNNKDGRFS